MGLLQEFNQLKDKATGAGGKEGPKTEFDYGAAQFMNDLDSNKLGTYSDIYETNYNNWYRALPYGFQFRDRKGERQVIFLPISPQNLTITTHYATNVITTLYGTVEEHSSQRYYDILIEGVTGITPKYVNTLTWEEATDPEIISASKGAARKSQLTNKAVVEAATTGGFFSKTVGLINTVKQRASDTVNTITGNDPRNKTGVENNQTGYTAFHRLYKFFLIYKMDAAGINKYGKPIKEERVASNGSAHPLTFLNYKDSNMYDVSIQRFVMKRDISNPMLYKYSIALRAYNLRPLYSMLEITDDVESRKEELGLAGIKSSNLLAQARKAATAAKATFGAALGGVNTLGR